MNEALWTWRQPQTIRAKFFGTAREPILAFLGLKCWIPVITMRPAWVWDNFRAAVRQDLADLAESDADDQRQLDARHKLEGVVVVQPLQVHRRVLIAVRATRGCW